MIANIAEMVFTDTKDTLQRKILAENIIIRLKLKTVSMSPILLDGTWGSGKSVFCHQLKNFILDKYEKDFKVTYINAFMFDTVEDPFLMIISHILEVLDIEETDRKSLVDKSIKVLQVVTKVGAKALLGAITRQNSDNIISDIADATKEEASLIIDKLFSSFAKAQATINELKEIIKKSIKKENKKLIVIIDEFDRCKPTFALEILEKVKHVFDIEGMEFIFSMNAKELCSTIKKQYGTGINSEEYLSKFYNYKIQIPMFVKENYYACFYLEEKLKESFEMGEKVDAVIKDIGELVQKYKLSLRDIDKFVLNLKIFFELNNRNSGIMFDVVSILEIISIYICSFNVELSENLLAGSQETSNQMLIAYFKQEAHAILPRPNNAILPHILCSETGASLSNIFISLGKSPQPQGINNLHWYLPEMEFTQHKFRNIFKAVFNTLNMYIAQ